MNLEPLRGISRQVDPDTLPLTEPHKEVIYGRLGATDFMVSVATSGQVEASLSKNRTSRVTDAQVEAFFRKWGCQPKFEDFRARNCRMFVVVDIRPEYNN